jgi:hypothetical protein
MPITSPTPERACLKRLSILGHTEKSEDLIVRRDQMLEMDLPPFLAQRVKTQNSSKGEFESWGYHAGSSRKSSRLPRYGS